MTALLRSPFEIIDISQPVNSKSACFPGDVPFSREISLTYKDSGVVNLTSFKMSPHVGSHADAPVHIEGSLEDGEGMVSELPLDVFVGPVRVVDLAPLGEGISKDMLTGKLAAGSEIAGEEVELDERILFKTRHRIRYDIFEDDYAYILPDLAHFLAGSATRLIGLDTPSVDHVNSKSLECHHILREGGLFWLENLDLSSVEEGNYTLLALPLKLEELEAAPVRAVLLRENTEK